MQSVASISPLDPRSTPAPDRKDAGSDSDSFSQMLDVVAKPADDPAPEAAPSSPPSSGDPSSPAPRKTAPPPADGSSAQPQDDSGKTSASSGRPAGNASKTGDATAEDKNSGKGSKQTSKDDSAKDATQAVVAIDPAQGAPQTGTVAVAAALVALDVPKLGSGGSAVAGGDSGKVAGEFAAAADATTPTIPTAPTASAAPETPNPSTATSQAAAIGAAAKGKRAFAASGPLAAADDASQAAASAVPAAKAFAQAAKSAVAGDSGDSNPKPLAADKAASGNLPVQPAPAGTDDGKPASSGGPAAVAVLAAKVAPDSHAPSAASANQDLAAAVTKDASATLQSAQPTAIPESLRTLVSSLDPASSQVQTPGTSTSTQSVPATSAAIAVAIATRANEGSRQFDIRLDPPELGRIDVHLDVDKDGGVSTRLTVDRPETLDLLQSDARGLERALQSAGLKTEDGSLQFSLRQQSPDGSAGQQQAQGGTDPRAGTVYVEEDEPASTGLDQYQWAARQRGGVDIRV